MVARWIVAAMPNLTKCTNCHGISIIFTAIEVVVVCVPNGHKFVWWGPTTARVRVHKTQTNTKTKAEQQQKKQNNNPNIYVIGCVVSDPNVAVCPPATHAANIVANATRLMKGCIATHPITRILHPPMPQRPYCGDELPHGKGKWRERHGTTNATEGNSELQMKIRRMCESFNVIASRRLRSERCRPHNVRVRRPLVHYRRAFHIWKSGTTPIGGQHKGKQRKRQKWTISFSWCDEMWTRVLSGERAHALSTQRTLAYNTLELIGHKKKHSV